MIEEKNFRTKNTKKFLGINAPLIYQDIVQEY